MRQRMQQRRSLKVACRVSESLLSLVLVASAIGLAYGVAPDSAAGPPNQQRVKTRPTPIPQPVGKVEYTEACLRVLVVGARDTSFWIKAQYVTRIGTRLRFSLESPEGHRQLLTYVEDEQLASMFLIGGNLVATVGDIGDHSVVRIFHLGKDKVSVVFNRATKADPDFVWGPGQGSDAETLLVYSGRNSKGQYNLPSEAEIYMWDGRAFVLKVKVPYDERFSALADMERATEK